MPVLVDSMALGGSLTFMVAAIMLYFMAHFGLAKGELFASRIVGRYGSPKEFWFYIVFWYVMSAACFFFSILFFALSFGVKLL